MELSRPGRACRRRPPTLRDATLAIGLAPWGYGPRGITPWGSAATIVSRPTRRRPRAELAPRATARRASPHGPAGRGDSKPRWLPTPNSPAAGWDKTMFAQEVCACQTRQGRGRWPANGTRFSRAAQRSGAASAEAHVRRSLLSYTKNSGQRFRYLLKVWLI
jgi:hypothetical protein